MSADRISDAARKIDARYAELISQRRDREAMALRAVMIARFRTLSLAPSESAGQGGGSTFALVLPVP